MSSNLVDFIFEEPKQSLLEFLLLEFTSLKKFDDYNKVLSFYHNVFLPLICVTCTLNT